MTRAAKDEIAKALAKAVEDSESRISHTHTNEWEHDGTLKVNFNDGLGRFKNVHVTLKIISISGH